MRSLTFDTGALIALERGDKRMRVVLDTARIRADNKRYRDSVNFARAAGS